MDDEVTLIAEFNWKDEDGFDVPEKHYSDIFGEAHSTVRNEFYKALSEGIHATKSVKIFKDDFEGSAVMVRNLKIYPKKLQIGETIYKIERMFDVEDDMIELTCSEVE